MGELMFGSGPGHLPEQANEIASPHGAYLVNYTDERGEERHWFCAANRGWSFDDPLSAAVLADIKKAGVEATKACPGCDGTGQYENADCEVCSASGRVAMDYDPRVD